MAKSNSHRRLDDPSLAPPTRVYYSATRGRVTLNSLQTRRVTAQELADYDSDVSAQRVPLKDTLLQSLRTPAVLWCAGSFLMLGMTNWGMLTWLPTYLLQARGFSAEKMSYLAAATNLSGVVGFALGGYLCDKYFRNNIRILIAIGAVLTASFTYLAATASTGEWAVVCFAAAFLSSGLSITLS